MFYVYHGYVSPDNYDCSNGPIYKISEFQFEHEVLTFRKQFDEDILSDCANVIFRVFEGGERKIMENKVVVSYCFKP